jgi:hypothetical protein
MVVESQPKVWLINDALTSVEPKPENWLNKDFLKVEKIKAVSVTSTNATNSWKLTRESDTAEFNLADDISAGRINGGRIVASAVESKNTFCGWVKKYCVGVVADRLHFVDYLQALEIEDAYCAFAAVAGEPSPELIRQCNAVNSNRLWNISHRLAGVGINDDYVCGARDKQAMRLGINGQVVPSAVAAELIGFYYAQVLTSGT